MKLSRRGILKILTALIVLVMLALGAQIFLAGYLFDRNIDKVLSRVEARVPALSLSYESTSSSIFSREGLISWSLKLPDGAFPGLENLNGQSELKLRFAPLKVTGSFAHVKDQGNVNEFLSRLNLEPISYQGAFKATALMPRASFAVKTSAFHIPLEVGTCYMGESSFLFEATSLSNILTELNFAGLDCRGSEQYADRESFSGRLEGLFVRLRPYIEDGKPYLDTIESGLKSLSLDVSTLFAIGFGPDEEVKDPTLREALQISDLSSRVSFTDKNDLGQGVLNFDGTGNFAFAFPSVIQGQEQDFYTLDNLKLAGTIDRVSLTETVQRLLSLKDSSDLPKIMEGFSKPLAVILKEFSFDNKGGSLFLDAASAVDFKSSGSISSLKLDLNFSSAPHIVEDFAKSFAYENELKRALEAGIFLERGGKLESRLQVDGRRVTINGQVINNLREGEDVVEGAE